MDCDGLADGWARRLVNHEPVHAGQVTREDGPFYCASCHAEVVLRHGVARVAHFAHPGDRFAARAGEEGALHRACKEEIRAALALAHPDGNWALERRIPARMDAHVPDLRPDASGRVRGQPLAIEVQASALGVDAILQRTQAYTRRKVAILWVLPRNEPPPGDALATRLHERYLHSMYLGRVYYWWPGLGGTVLPVHFGPATRDMPGGYEAAYRAIRTPWCAPRLDIGQDFQPFRRPAGQLWMDRLKPWW